MVILLFKDDISKSKELITTAIKDEKIIIYPTDTLYGIGGRADSDEVVKKIYEIKRRENNKSLTFIAPDFDFIENNFSINSEVYKKIHSYLPGKYTLILHPKNDCPISKKCYLNTNTIGVRMCNHFIQDIVYSTQIPLICTSANVSNEASSKCFDDISVELLKQVDLAIIDDDNMSKKGSTIIEFLKNGEEKIIR